MTQRQLAEELYRRYGSIRRARGCFLYTQKGMRLTDMFLQDGRAILGWDGGTAFTQFKNTLNRGILGTFITEEKSRLEKSLSELLGSPRHAFVFATKQDALKAALRFSPHGTAFWRPWNKNQPDAEALQAAVLAPPLPWTDCLFITAVSAGLSEETGSVARPLPGEIFLPFPLEAAITRANYNLIAALKTRTEQDWFTHDSVLTKYWTREGPYLFPKIPSGQYDAFITHCLDAGIVINPDYNSPSIVPFGADKGIFTRLKNGAFEP